MWPSVKELFSMNNLMQPYMPEPVPTPESNVKPCGLTGKQWAKRKSRAKIAKASRKRNR